MATNTAGTDAREYHTSQTHYLRFDIDGNTATGVNHSMGYIPAGSLVVGGGIVVKTDFDGTAIVDIGTAADGDAFAHDVAIGSMGFKEADALANSASLYVAADTEVVCSLANTTSITAGVGVVFIEYMPDLG